MPPAFVVAADVVAVRIIDAGSVVVVILVVLVAAAVVSLVNVLLQLCIPRLTKLENHITLVAYERAVFLKLSVAYFFNAVALPFVIGFLPFGITQAWYEEGGIAYASLSIILASGMGSEAVCLC